MLRKRTHDHYQRLAPYVNIRDQARKQLKLQEMLNQNPEENPRPTKKRKSKNTSEPTPDPCVIPPDTPPVVPNTGVIPNTQPGRNHPYCTLNRRNKTIKFTKQYELRH